MTFLKPTNVTLIMEGDVSTSDSNEFIEDTENPSMVKSSL